MRKQFIPALLLLSMLVGCSMDGASADSATRTSLAGTWRFAMDRNDEGVKANWQNTDLKDKIQLPGILQSQGYGDEISVDTPWVAALPRDMRWYLLPQYKEYTKPGNVKVPYLSQPVSHYLGVAWYQRDIEIPNIWIGQRAHLSLERPHWETTVWVDDQKIGSNNSLCAPHEFELGRLLPGKHRLSIRIDNRMILPYRPDGHSVSDALGATWNGIAGKIELSASNPVWIDDAQVFPNVTDKSALVKIKIGNLTGAPGSGTISAGSANQNVTWDAKGGEAEITVPLGANAQLWDEFHPVLQHLTIKLASVNVADSRDVTFGLREIKAEGKNFVLNGHEVNFRGTHSGGDFPLTGYPATDVASWKRIFQICKDYGLNSMRFHSYCPPDAAFTAADELGFYIQPECGMWNDFSKPGIPEMLEAETTRIMKAYGNHPSFLLLSASNEPAGNWQRVLLPWASNWYKADPRRLYAANTGRSSPTAAGPQYAITPARGNSGWWGRDYSRSTANAIMPVLGHEVGQWCAYPDFDVINKFTGYLKPGNYEIYRDSAVLHDMLKNNKEWAYNSGKFQLACYKEECEANLRTAGYGGYQLLDLHDYIGQGGALVGVLDPFWDAKSYVTPELFRRFSGPIVPLARLRSVVVKQSDPFDIDVELAQYGDGPISQAHSYWKIVDLDGKVAVQGEFPVRDLPIGKNIPLGKVTVDLTKIAAPRQYKLVVGIANTKAENDWNFWLYPADVPTAPAADVVLTSDWKEAQSKLAAGGKVLFVPTNNDINRMSPPLNNVPFFWNRLMNPSRTGEGMLGLLVNPKHPALAEFPSQTWCDWEWSELVHTAHAINVENAPKDLKPIVQAIDDWSRNYNLGVIFESKVGNGKLLVCSIDLGTDLDRRSGAKQLRHSLLDYMASAKFQPGTQMTPQQADSLFPGPDAPSATQPAFRPQALPGDIIEGQNAPRPGGQ